MELIVADSSPLIALANIGGLEWLQSLFTRVLVPEAVAVEIEHREVGDSPWFTLKTSGFVEVAPCNASDRRLILLRQQLDAGESEAIVLALQQRLPLLIGERAGRNLARELGVSVIGLVGVLLALKRDGHLSDTAMPMVVDALEQASFLMSADLKSLLLSD